MTLELQQTTEHIGSGRGRIVVDLDDTLVENAWPELGAWKPGAVSFIRGQLERGREVVIFSTRFAPTTEDEETLRNQNEVEDELERAQRKFESAALNVTFWTLPWKPGGQAYVDDKAVAARGDWSHVERKIDELVDGLPKRHPASARFHEILSELGDLHDRKQADYGRGNDPFSNVRSSEEWGVLGWVGALVRGTDKLRRLQSLLRKGKLENESAEDSLRDLAVYSIIALVLFEEARDA